MIKDYSDPKVTLKQQYAAVTLGTSATLGACIIGPSRRTMFSYKLHGDLLSVLNTAVGGFLTMPAISDTKIPDIITDNVYAVLQSCIRLYSENANVMYLLYSKAHLSAHKRLLSVLILPVSGMSGSYKIRIKYTDGTYARYNGYGKDSIKPIEGDFVTCFSNANSPTFRVSDTGSDSVGQYIVGSTSNSITTEDPGGYHSVGYYRNGLKVYIDNSFVNIDVDNDTFNVAAACRTTPVALLGLAAFSYPIVRLYNLYVLYTAIDTSIAGKLRYIAATTDQLVLLVLGLLTLDNPLACAVACACAAADSNFVYYIATDYDSTVSDSVLDPALIATYLNAMDLAINNDAIHGIVPCTTNKAVLNGLLSKAIAAADELIPYFKYIYASTSVPKVTLANTHTEATETIIARKAFSNKRGLITFADGPEHNGVLVPPYCVAAAVAGLRSASLPHAPLSNVMLPGITTKDASGFTASDLKALGANGFLRVGLNSDDLTIIRRQLTSAAKGDVNYDEQSIVCNIDSICLNIKNSGKGYVGNTNISLLLLSLLQVELQDRLRGFSLYVNSLIGPQLLSWLIVNLAQHPVYKDRIYVTILGLPPKPFNRFDITFRMI